MRAHTLRSACASPSPRRIHDHPRSNLDALGFQMIIDRFQHHLAEPIILNQMAELADRRVVWRRLIAKINSREVTHRGAVIKAVFGLRIRHVEPLL